MCEWCERFAKTKWPLRWYRHLDNWGTGYINRSPNMWMSLELKRQRKIIYIRRASDKPRWAEKFRDRSNKL